MGEEDKKKPEEKMEEKKSEESRVKPEGKKEEEKEKKKKKEPQEIVLKIFMHCEGCAKKIYRCLKGFEGVEDVTTDCKTSKVVVKGEKADPLKVLQRLQRKSHRQVELLSPIPDPKPVSDEQEKKEKEKPKPEEKIQEVVTVVLRVHMHCEACAMEIQKRIMRMKGVETVEPDFKASQVSVKGVFPPEKLVQYVYKKIGKHAAVVKQEPPPKAPEKETKDKDENKKEGEHPKEGKEAKEGSGGGVAKSAATGSGAAVEEENKVVDMKKNEYQYQPPRYPVEMFAYPPQIFSDENPNACTMM